VAPASITNTVLLLPISGGRIAVASFAGVLNHNGGLTFCHHSKKVTLTNFVMNTQTKRLIATVSGKPLPIFDLNLASLKHASGAHRTIIASNIGLMVTPKAAGALNSGLGVTTFKSQQAFGVATTLVQTKP
jgi:hypothetical protein